MKFSSGIFSVDITVYPLLPIFEADENNWKWKKLMKAKDKERLEGLLG